MPFNLLGTIGKQSLLFLAILFFPLQNTAETIIVPTASINNIGGQLSTRYLQRISDDKEAGNEESEFVTTATISWRNVMLGYIWKPWFGTWTGNTNLALEQKWQSGERYSKSSLMGILGETKWGLNLFPVSRFPFRSSLDLSHQNEEKDYRDELITRFRLNLEQRYTFPNKTTTANAKIMVQGRDSQLSGNSNGFEMSLGGNHRMGPHAFQGEIKYRMQQSDQPDTELDSLQKNGQLNLFVRHRYNPLETLSIENFGNFFSDNEIYELTQKQQINWQINSNTQWRPELEPRLTVSGGARLSANNNDNSSADGRNLKSEQLNFNLYSGANFDYSPTIRLGASINVNATQDENNTTASSQQRVNASYSPESLIWGPYEYNWFTSGNIQNNIVEDQNYQQVSASIGQSVKRDLMTLLDNPIRLNISNQLTGNVTSQSNDSNSAAIRNRISLSHRYKEQALYYNSQLAYDDEWGIVATDNDTKKRHTFSALLNGNYQLERHTSWSADLTFELDSEDKVNGDSRTNFSSSGFFSYRNNQIFDIFKLRFLSRLSLSMQDVLSDNAIEQEENFSDKNLTSTVWENRLSYQLGRFLFNSRLSLTKNQDSTNGLIMFELKRTFGFLQ